MLEIKNYSLEYIKGKKAVDNISLEIQNGDIFIVQNAEIVFQVVKS